MSNPDIDPEQIVLEKRPEEVLERTKGALVATENALYKAQKLLGEQASSPSTSQSLDRGTLDRGTTAETVKLSFKGHVEQSMQFSKALGLKHVGPTEVTYPIERKEVPLRLLPADHGQDADKFRHQLMLAQAICEEVKAA